MKLRTLKKEYKKFLFKLYGKNKENKKQYIFFIERTNDKLGKMEFTYYLFKGKFLKKNYDFYGRKIK